MKFPSADGSTTSRSWDITSGLKADQSMHNQPSGKKNK